ncbi:hypothetical protein U8C43_24385 [Sinorhizobium meliloti]|nr:hypothetical protein U8C30_24420 [Sinorhizobium meliloti]WQP29000.1 hypothetical protein U8C43_24385 [Sinorhizobium meliloti]
MTDNDFLDSLLTPEEIARRITASSGVKMTARTVWEKARRDRRGQEDWQVNVDMHRGCSGASSGGEAQEKCLPL